MHLADLSSLPGILAINGDAPIDSVTVDSRTAAPGKLFIAAAGQSFDGHDFVQEAMSAGAAVAVSRLDIFESVTPAILIDDAAQATWRICKKVYGDPSSRLRLIGVTGTNGKTTVAWMLRQALESLGKPSGYMGTLGGYVGNRKVDTGLTTPFPPQVNEFLIQCLENGIEYVTMEVSSHALAQKRVDGIEFDVAVFTNLSQDHLDYHADFDEYFEAKLRLFHDLPSEKRLVSVINIDDEYGKKIAVDNCLTFGSNGDIKLIDSEATLDSVRIHAEYLGELHAIYAQTGAKFNVSNTLAVFGALLALGMDPKASISAIRCVRGAPGRFESIPNSRGFNIIVDYAHTPDALEKVLQSARELTIGKLICVFGCGGDRDRTKRPKMAVAASSFADVVWVTSDNPRTEDPEAIIADIIAGLPEQRNSHVEPDRRKAIQGAISEAGIGDCVVIAGKGHEDYQIIGKEKTHFDDREVAAEFLG